MKTTFKTLPFMFFIPLLLLILPLHSKAEEEASTQTKDIQILIGDDEVTKVSIEDIKERLLKGEPVFFVKEQEETKRTIKAEWITNALKKEYGVEKIDINNAIINGNLDFTDIALSSIDCINNSELKRELKKQLKNKGLNQVHIVSAPIKIENTRLINNLIAGREKDSMYPVVFQSDVSFCCNFLGEAHFRDSIFNGKVSFHKTCFENEVDFWGTTFNMQVTFLNVIFMNTESKETIPFSKASFNGETFFWGTTFEREVSFWKSSFRDRVYFHEVNFNNDVSFLKANFNKDAKFNKTKFKKYVRLESVDFKEDAIFDDKVIFYGNVDLRSARYSEMQISWAQLDGRLDDLRSKEEKKDIVYWRGAYLRLIKNFENIGDTKSAYDAYYHYRYTSCKFYNSCLEKAKWLFGFIFMGLTCGYGVIPWRAIATALFLVLAFTGVYLLKTDSLESKENGHRDNRSFWDCLYFSVVTFTTLGYGDLRPLGKFRYVAMTEGIFGWLTMALFLVTLANVWL